MVAKPRGNKGATLAIALAAIAVGGAAAVALINRHPYKPFGPAPGIAPTDGARAAFNELDNAITGYLDAANDFVDIFARRGRDASASEVARDEIDTSARRLSATYHELDENGHHYVLELQRGLPASDALLARADELVSFVLRNVQANDILELDKVTDAVNDAKSDVHKQSQLATERLETLRQAFRAALANADDAFR